MILERIYEDRLAQASYLIGCTATGEALVVDPNRDIARYRRLAQSKRLRITHVTETHIHADFLSGSRELAEATGARLFLPGEGGRDGAGENTAEGDRYGAGDNPGERGEDWSYRYADEANAELLRDGDSYRVGNIRIDVVHTPGHTPEHLTFLVTDGATADEPIGALTGDFIFVGDVGRPDLLEKSAGEGGAAESAARDLFRSLARFKKQPDWLQIWPGHGAGSACGKSMSAVPHSTLGYEKRFNRAFSIDNEDAFVRAILEGQPEPPKYFAVMKRLNRDGPPPLRGVRRPERIAEERLLEVLDGGALVVDTRPAGEYAAWHLRGTINIPLNRSFPTWAGWLIPYDRDFYLLSDDTVVDNAARELALIGLLEHVAGWSDPGAIAAASRNGENASAIRRISVEDVPERIATNNVAVLDVRWDDEWKAGHLPDGPDSGRAPVLHIPLGYLPERLDEIPRDRPILVHCHSGSRSAIAASILERNGFGEVVDFSGGYRAWREAGLAVDS